MRHIRSESAAEIACAQDMFETIFKDYPQEKDVHISGLLAVSLSLRVLLTPIQVQFLNLLINCRLCPAQLQRNLGDTDAAAK